MTKTYTQLLKQIEKLKGEAEGIRRKEVDGVIDRIKEAISAYGLTASDLGLGAARRGRPPKGLSPKRRVKRAKAKSAAAPKFRDEAGNTWVGRGKRPDWLRKALAEGHKLEDFQIR